MEQDLTSRFIFVDDEEATDILTHDPSSRRGRVSYPLIKGFLESSHDIAKMNRTGMKHPAQHYHTLLTGYIKTHSVPVVIKLVNGELYFIRKEYYDRINKDEEGLGSEGSGDNGEVGELTPETIAALSK